MDFPRARFLQHVLCLLLIVTSVFNLIDVNTPSLLLKYACPYVAIFNPCLFILNLNLFSFKFKLHVQNLFKFKPNSCLNLIYLI